MGANGARNNTKMVRKLVFVLFIGALWGVN
jgi:hypothetical protein